MTTREPGRSSQPLQVLLLAILPFAAAWSAGCSDGEDSAGEGTRAMVARLEQLARDSDSGRAAFGGLFVSEIELQGMPERLEDQINYEVKWGGALLLEGRSEEAIEKFESALAKLEGSRDLFAPSSVHRIHRFLAISHLRAAEQENCLKDHNADSCLMPIRAAGVHRFPTASRAAFEEYLWLVEDDSEDWDARWLLHIAAMTVGEYPDGVPAAVRISERAFASDYEIPRFHDVAPGLGLDVVALSGGSILDDFDGDGDLDLFASSWKLRDQLHYFQNGADGTFAERTEEAGLLGIMGGLNITHADYDNDGHNDVFVPRGAWIGKQGRGQPNSLLRNLGDATFEDTTEAAGMLSFHPTQVGPWADFDRDGQLDLFVGNETRRDNAHSCELYRNDGDGTFTNVAGDAGLALRDFVKGATWGDYDNDGFPDLYVTSLQRPNKLLHNTGRFDVPGWFEDRAVLAGVDAPRHAFATWFWDYDNDGWLDVFAAPYGVGILKDEGHDVGRDYSGRDFREETPGMYRNNGDGTFENMTEKLGLARSLYVMGANFGDIDNDGFLDMYLGTGAPSFEALMPNRMFRNAGGRAFQDVTTAGGFGHLQKGHGISFGDVDNDGDQDIYAVMGGAYNGDVYQNALFENPGNANHWVTLRLEGTRSNRSAIGAHLRLVLPSQSEIHRTVGTGGSFGSSSLQQEIGLGGSESIARLEIIWPASDGTQVFENVAADRVYRIREGGEIEEVESRAFALSAGPVAGGHAHPGGR